MRRSLLLGGPPLPAAYVPPILTNLAHGFVAGQSNYQTSGGALATTDGDPIGEWQDLSGNGRHLAQPTAASRLTLKTGVSGLDGLPVVRGDGVDDFMTGAVPASAVWTRYLVCRKRSAPSASLRYLEVMQDTNSRFEARTSDGAGWNFIRNEAGATVSLGGTPVNWQILVYRYTSTSLLEVWSGGTLLGSFDPNNGYSTSILYGLAAISTGSNPGDFDYAAILGYNAAQTNAQINTLAASFQARYPSLVWSAI